MRLIEWIRRRPSVATMVRDQLDAGEPAVVRESRDRLRAAGISERRTLQLLCWAFKVELDAMMKERRPFDRNNYAALLRKLPSQVQA